ncbi:MAG: response regulator, partial [Pyrinomonadaceae bacterium]
SIYSALDIVARIEAAVWNIPLHSNDFLTDVSGFVDSSFSEFLPQVSEAIDDEDFEIDEETLDIFRSEADELLANMATGIRVLSTSPGDKNALWDVRRSAHTFKGAAGIVGFKDASEAAHLMEDLLDRVVEMQHEAAPEIVAFLSASAEHLEAIVASKNVNDKSVLELQYAEVMMSLSLPPRRVRENTIGDNVRHSTDFPLAADKIRVTTTPIVRVSLDRLDELIKLSRSLQINRSALAERFAEFSIGADRSTQAFEKFESLFETQKNLTLEIQEKLLRIRMVKFGTLATRFSRAVNVTCIDENKKADVIVDNGDVEIDTQIIDALIEPLLHLLRNAVVHGIEPPDTRRLIGKPERGSIRIRIEVDDEALLLSVADDGAGISTLKLKEKAVANGILGRDTAAIMADREAIKLVFDRGLTTAAKIDLNAGRGVGMSIVKESVENRGGTVLVESEPQLGTTFTIMMPFSPQRVEPVRTENVAPKVRKERALLPAPLVLIVDDSPSVRRQTSIFVEEQGFRVITANNGAEALELLLSGDWEPDMILSDVEMPQIDGWAFLEYVKTDANLGHIPVVMVTSLDAEEHRKRAFALGATDFVIKPFSGKELERILENIGTHAVA